MIMDKKAYSRIEMRGNLTVGKVLSPNKMLKEQQVTGSRY